MKIKAINSIIATLILILLGNISSLAANTYEINIDVSPMNIDDNRFYIKSIIDARDEKTNIGFVDNGFTKTPIVLKENLEMTLQSIMNQTFTNKEKKIPIIIKVIALYVGQDSSNQVLAKAKFIFYQESMGKLGKVFEIEDVALIHKISADQIAESIRMVTETCLKSFSESNWYSVIPNIREDYQSVISEKNNEKNVLHTIVVMEPEQRHIFLISGLYDQNRFYGAEPFSFYLYDANSGNKSGWVPISGLSFEFISINSPEGLKRLSYFKLSYGVFNRIKGSPFAFWLDFGIPFLGSERQDHTRREIYGLTLAQGILFIPNNKLGMTASIQVFEAVYGYANDQTAADFPIVGVKAALGFQY